ncbi:MAG: hypothetical protein ACQEQG_05440 [Bacillota bacterium]
MLGRGRDDNIRDDIYGRLNKMKGYLLVTAVILLALVGYSVYQGMQSDPSVQLFSLEDEQGEYFMYLPPDIDRDIAMPIIIHPFPGQAEPGSEELREEARTQIKTMQIFADESSSPLLVPVLAGSEFRDEATLDRLTRMFQQGIEELQDFEYTIAEQAYLFGYDASALTASRWLVFNPDHVLKAALGAPGGWPAVPVETYQGVELEFPLGRGGLAGSAVDFSEIEMFIFQGEEDEFNLLDDRAYFTAAERELIEAELGEDTLAQLDLAAELYGEAGAQVEFKVYPDLDHRIPMEVKDDIVDFFREN